MKRQRVAEGRLGLRILIIYRPCEIECGRTFKMADEQGVNFEPESKRPRISLESTSTVNQSVNEELKTNQAQCENREKLNPEKSAQSSCPVQHVSEHVQNDKLNKTEEIFKEDGEKPSQVLTKTKPGSLKYVSVSEKDVGILEFVSGLPGFHGVLKQRYADFIVSERDLKGNLVRLTDVSVPQNEKSKEFDLDILGEEDKEKIKKVADDEEKKISMTLSPDDDKDHRRLVHRAIRENFSALGIYCITLIYTFSFLSFSWIFFTLFSLGEKRDVGIGVGVGVRLVRER